MTQPCGFISSDKTLVCKLQKTIYGLKQSPRAWYERITGTLLSFGFTQCKCDPSLLVYNLHGHCIYILIYVDDIFITGSSLKLVQVAITKLNGAFYLKQLGDLDYFLVIEVKHTPNDCILLNQAKYICDLLHIVDMEIFPEHLHSSTSKS